MKIGLTPECTRCSKRYPLFDDGTGLPIMLRFETAKGRKILLCRNCPGELGRMKETGKLDQFFTDLFEEGNDV